MSPDDRVLVVTAVRAETRAILAAVTHPTRRSIGGRPGWTGRAGDRTISLIQVGIGPEKARAALVAMDEPLGLVITVGFAGALVPDSSPGDIVLPELVLWEHDGERCRYEVPPDTHRTAAAQLSLPPASAMLRGSLFSSPAVVTTPAAKRALAARTGAVAVEMETGALIEVACERGAAVLALRVILDTVEVSLDGIPPDLETSWGARARLIVQPAAWIGVAAIARHLPRATRALTRAAAAVLPAVAIPG